MEKLFTFRWQFTGKTVVLAIMSVPKAAVHKNDGLVFWEDNIGSSRIYPVSEPSFPQIMAQFPFRPGVGGPDLGHHLGTLLF